MTDRLVTEMLFRKTLYYGNLAVKIALIMVITSLAVSSILLFVFDGISESTYHTWYSVVIWYSVIGSMWVLICSPIYLLLAGVYIRYIEGQGLKLLRGQLILLLLAICVSAAFICVTLLTKK